MESFPISFLTRLNVNDYSIDNENELKPLMKLKLPLKEFLLQMPKLQENLPAEIWAIISTLDQFYLDYSNLEQNLKSYIQQDGTVSIKAILLHVPYDAKSVPVHIAFKNLATAFTADLSILQKEVPKLAAQEPLDVIFNTMQYITSTETFKDFIVKYMQIISTVTQTATESTETIQSSSFNENFTESVTDPNSTLRSTGTTEQITEQEYKDLTTNPNNSNGTTTVPQTTTSGSYWG